MMLVSTTYLKFIIIGLCLDGVVTIIRSSCKVSANFNIVLKGMADKGVKEGIKKVKSERQCTLECASLPKCRSLNYLKIMDRCELLGRSLNESKSSLQEQSDSIYMTTDELALNQGETCKKISPCKNGARCEDVCSEIGFKCTCHLFYYGIHCDKVINDCTAVKNSGKTANGMYKIKYDHENIMDVYCNVQQLSEGWIVIQRRVDGNVDFYRNWASYKSGFGDTAGNFWIGLDKLHKLARPGKGAILRIDIKHRNSPTSQYYANYYSFEIGDEASGYKLLVEGYSGNAGNAMSYHNGMKFSTFDNDNDLSSAENCASRWKGAWWYKICHNSNLNGLYPTTTTTDPSYMSWYHLHNAFGNVLYSEMKIRYHM